MTQAVTENWRRSYKIEFGVPEYEKEEYFFDAISANFEGNSQGAKIVIDSHTVPAEALSMSNLEEDGNPRRGFTFSMDSTRKASSGGNSTSEKTTILLPNLNKSSLDLLNSDNCVIRVSAGYQEELSLAYSGDVVEVTPMRQSSDIIHRIRCIDGATSAKNTAGVVSFTEEVSEKDMILDLANRFPDASLGFVALEDLGNEFTTGGQNYQGQLDVIFNRIMARNNLTYTRYNGKINIFPYSLDQASADFKRLARNTYKLPTNTVKSIIPVSKNGKKKSLETKTKTGVNVNTHYFPIELGQFFTISEEISEEYTGTYLTTGIRTVLKSHGREWDVVLTGEPV
jgi:hypothetical protein